MMNIMTRKMRHNKLNRCILKNKTKTKVRHCLETKYKNC